jgi:hypothetical protein
MNLSAGNLELPRRVYRGPVVIVEGPAAVAIAGFIRANRSEWRQFVAPYAVTSIEIPETIAALELCAQAFRRSQVPTAEPMSVPITEPGIPSKPMETTEQAAARRGVSDSWVRRQLRDGRLPGRKIAGRWMVEREEAT